ncbi:unnamed protein product, partial [Staurois parvus]
MGRSQKLREFKRGTLIGCHLCNKSIREISLLQNIPQSTVSGIIPKWKQLGTTATTEQGQLMLKCTVCRSRQLSAESIAKDLQTSLPVKRTFRASAYQDILDNFMLPNFVGSVWGFQYDCAPV